MDDNKHSMNWPGPDDAHVPAWTPPGASVPPPPSSASSTPAPPPPPAGDSSATPNAAAMPSYRAWEPGIIPLRPLGFAEFLSTPFKAMRYNRAVVLGGPLIFTLVATILSIAGLWMLMNELTTSASTVQWDLGSFLNFNDPSTATVVVLLAAVVTSGLADILSTSIVAPGVARAVAGERVTFGQAWSAVVRRLGHIFLLYLFTAVAMVAAFVVPFIILGAGIAEDQGGLVAGAVLLFLVLTLPTLVAVAIITGVSRPMIVLEKISAPQAIARAVRLIRGRFWWSILIVFVSVIVIYTVAVVLQSVGQFVAIFAVTLFADSFVAMLVAISVFSGVTTLVTYVLMYSFMGAVFTLIYIDLRMRREGFHLDLARAAEARGL